MEDKPEIEFEAGIGVGHVGGSANVKAKTRLRKMMELFAPNRLKHADIKRAEAAASAKAISAGAERDARLLAAETDAKAARLEAAASVTRAIGSAIGSRAASEIQSSNLGEETRALLAVVLGDAQGKADNVASIIQTAEVFAGELPPYEEPEVTVELDPDWLAVFFSDAELVSRRDAQAVYARILAGELNRPGSFSKRTLSLLKLLDQETAKSFALVRSCLINASYVLPVWGDWTPPYGRLDALQAAGLLTGLDWMLVDPFICNGRIVRLKATEELRKPLHRLTQSGIELSRILPCQEPEGFFDELLRVFADREPEFARVPAGWDRKTMPAEKEWQKWETPVVSAPGTIDPR